MAHRTTSARSDAGATVGRRTGAGKGARRALLQAGAAYAGRATKLAGRNDEGREDKCGNG